MLAGLRYVRGAPLVRSILIRTGAFSVAASSLPALLPILARPHGATGYGLLLGFFGLGALSGAAVLPRMRNRFSVDRLVAFDILLFAAMTFAAGRVQTFSLLCLVLFASGTAWIGILACLNIAAQLMCPSFLRARALSMYLLVLQGGMALGSTAWGALATRVGVPSSLLYSSVALVVGLLAVRRHRLSSQPLELTRAVRD
jgi:predicted MFS family arabinose efflux permease